MQLQFLTLDVFAPIRFQGNPVAIIKVPSNVELTQDQKQLIAREFNLSESVFLHEQTKTDRESGDVRIDIFTSIAEVPFAGHPTIGTANYLLHHIKDASVLALQTKAGRVPISVAKDGVRLDVAHNVHVHNSPFPNTSFSHYPVVSIVKGMTFILAALPDLDSLARPTQNLIGTVNTYKSQHILDQGWQEGIICSYFYVDCGHDKDGTRRLRTRMFGSREDPATGSAASALCSYLSLQEKEGGVDWTYQLTQGVEMGRQSDIYVKVTLNDERNEIEKVTLSGTAWKVMEGLLDV